VSIGGSIICRGKDPNTHPTPYPLILCTHRNSHWSFTHDTTPSPPWQVFFIIGLGYFLRRLSAFPEEYVQALNSFTMKLALPALLFVSGLQGLVGGLVKVIRRAELELEVRGHA